MMGDSDLFAVWPHTRVGSVRGPEWCCHQCSTNAKRYVEWPCAGTQLLTFALLGALGGDRNKDDTP